MRIHSPTTLFCTLRSSRLKSHRSHSQRRMLSTPIQRLAPSRTEFQTSPNSLERSPELLIIGQLPLSFSAFKPQLVARLIVWNANIKTFADWSTAKITHLSLSIFSHQLSSRVWKPMSYSCQGRLRIFFKVWSMVRKYSTISRLTMWSLILRIE